MNDKIDILLQKYQAAGPEKRSGMLEVLHITDEETAVQLEREIKWLNFRELPFDTIIQFIAAQQNQNTEQVTRTVREYLFNNLVKVEAMPLDLGGTVPARTKDQIDEAAPEPNGLRHREENPQEIHLAPQAYPSPHITTEPPEEIEAPSAPRDIAPSNLSIITLEEPVETEPDHAETVKPTALNAINIVEDVPVSADTESSEVPAEEAAASLGPKQGTGTPPPKGMIPRF